MAYEVASIFTLKDNFTSHLKEMIGNQNKFKTDSKLLSEQLNSTYNTLKKESKTAGSAMSKALKEAQKEFNATGKHSDEMKKKIRDAVAQKVRLQFDTDSIKSAEKEIKKIDKEIKSINKEKISPKFESSPSKGPSILKNALGVASGIGIYNLGASAVNATGGVFMNALNQAGQREQSAIAFETMLKSKEKGQKMIGDLTKFAIATPFEYGDLEKNATFAMAMGFKDKELISLLTDVGNASSGLGKGTEGIESMVRALGQMQNKGKVSMEEINQLSENGVDALLYLGKATNKTKGEMMKYIEKGLVPADKAIEAIRKGMRNDFGGMMEKQGKSFFGLMSNVKDFVNLNVLGKFGEGLRLGVTPALTRFVNMLTNSKDGMGKFEDKLISAGKRIGEFISDKAEKLGGYFEELFSDEKFKNADLGGKITKVLEDMSNSMNTWYETGGGKTKIEGFFESLASSGTKVLTSDKKTKEFAGIGLKIGKSIMDGIGEGIANGLRDKIPFGQYYGKEGYLTPLIDMITGRKKKGDNTPDVITTADVKSRAMGVRRVPYDNYPIIAHEGEQLLTKQEANSKQQGNITIAKLADQIIVREEADIKKIADRLVTELKQAGLSYGGAF